MCKMLINSEPCWNYKCYHNLFWEGLRLNLDKIQITDKALEIRNCLCLVNEPWTAEEIGTVWGLPVERVNQCELMGWKKLKKEYPHIISQLNSRVMGG